MNLQKLSLTALLGYASAAKYGGRNKEWPAWATADKATLSAIPTTAEAGMTMVACARSLGVIVLPQVATANDDTAVPKANTGMALYAKASGNTGYGAFLAAGTVRTADALQHSCSGTTKGVNTKSWTKVAAGNAVLVDIATYAVLAAGGPSTTDVLIQSYDKDVILHAHQQKNDGTACDAKQRLETTAADQDIAMPAGMKAQDKCTIILEAKAKFGPGFKLGASGYNDYTLGWVEFSEDALSTAGQMPTTDASKLFMGSYAVANGPFINPVTGSDVGTAGSQFTKSDLTWYSSGNTEYFSPGYIGHYMYYPSNTNSVQTTNGFVAVPSTEIMSAFASLKSNYDDFNSKVNTYNPLKDAYNKALKDEKARKADSTRATFEAPITVPERPCPPSQPIAWWGADIDLKSITDFKSITDANKKLKKAGLQPHYSVTDDYTTADTWAVTVTSLDATTSKQDKKLTLNKGYMLHSEGTSGDWKYAGKTFGRLGSGEANFPEKTTAFRFDTVTDKKTYMYVSVFPAKNGASPAAISIKARYTSLAGMADFNAPSRPGAAANPDASGAKAIAVSTVAMALVASALY